MKQYGFGPNGAIMTSLNFFASQFNKVVDLIHKNSSKVSYVVLDTPGQIEVFTWSASGTIISESLTDIIDCGFAIEWMRDFEAFQDALAGSRSTDGPIELEADSSSGNSGTSPYMTSLINSMSLVLDEFYNELRCCGVSSITGEGMDKLLQEINLATNEYHEVYVPMLCKRRSSRKAAKGEQDGTKASHQCSSECTHADSEVTTAKLAMGPLGPGRPKRSKNTRHMLVDMAGDNDEVEGDAMVELDGLEQRDSSESDELEDAID
ncbi:ATP binding protein, partial [Opisthorchis viverrini]